MLNFLQQLIFFVPVILLAVIFHELAHAYVATWLGDDTPRREGRLTFNPLSHFDAMSLLFLLISGMIGGFFLMAKPVHVRTTGLRFPVLSEILVSLAGPLVNFIWALVLWPLFLWASKGLSSIPFLYQLLMTYGVIGIKINLIIAVFNLIPIPPLDGSALWMSFLRSSRYAYFRESMAGYGMFLILFIFVSLLLIPNDIVPKLSMTLQQYVTKILRWWKLG